MKSTAKWPFLRKTVELSTILITITMKKSWISTLAVAFIATSLAFTSCRNDDEATPGTTTGGTTTGTTSGTTAGTTTGGTTAGTTTGGTTTGG